MLTGLATVFDRLTVDQGGYRIKFAPAAFKKTLAKDPIFAAWMHDGSEIFASTKNKTLRIVETTKGLIVEIDVAPTARGMDAYTLVSGGYVTEMSVAFAYIKARGKTEKIDDEKIEVVEVSEAKLYEVSAVNKGAMPGTWIEAAAPSPAVSRQAAPMTDRQRIDALLRSATRPTPMMMSRAEVARRVRQAESRTPCYR
jgi:HK97 family phage prohead protease